MKTVNTKQLIMDAAKEIGRTHIVEEITVSEICKSCDISRQTFYTHFKDKYDLLGQIYSQTITSVMETEIDTRPWSRIIGKMLENVKKDKEFYLHALKFKGQNALTDNMFFYIYTGYLHEIEHRSGKEIQDPELLYAIRYNAYGGAGCMLDWIYNGMKEDPYEVAARIIACMPSRMSCFFD